MLGGAFEIPSFDELIERPTVEEAVERGDHLPDADTPPDPDVDYRGIRAAGCVSLGLGGLLLPLSVANVPLGLLAGRALDVVIALLAVRRFGNLSRVGSLGSLAFSSAMRAVRCSSRCDHAANASKCAALAAAAARSSRVESASSAGIRGSGSAIERRAISASILSPAHDRGDASSDRWGLRIATPYNRPSCSDKRSRPAQGLPTVFAGFSFDSSAIRMRSGATTASCSLGQKRWPTTTGWKSARVQGFSDTSPIRRSDGRTRRQNANSPVSAAWTGRLARFAICGWNNS